MLCRICGREFQPSKYRPRHQLACSDKKCQHQRHLGNMAKWRQDNPDYFKYTLSNDPAWIAERRGQMKEWRDQHPDKIVGYRRKRRVKHRGYMRNYMRIYRGRIKSSPSLPARQAQSTVDGPESKENKSENEKDMTHG